MTSHPKSDSRWGGPKVALGGIVALAAALRLIGVKEGPPPDATDADEQGVVRLAWDITHGGGLDPHPFFDHPSLLLYVLAPFQSWQEAPDYVAARLVVVAIGVAGVAAAWWLGTKAYDGVAGAVAAAGTAVATAHVVYSRAAVTDVLLTTLVTASLALLVSRRLELAGLVAGFAAAAKYPGALALVPLVAVAWGRWRRIGGAVALFVCGFVVASPFAVAHAGEAARDGFDAFERAREGSPTFAQDHVSPIAFADRLWESLGPVVVLAFVGLVIALVRRAPADRALASFALVYLVALLPLDAHFDRYVLPIVPVAAALAGSLRPVAPVTLLLLVVPLTWTIQDTRELVRAGMRLRSRKSGVDS